MTTAVTQITIHQLEQAIALKRAFRFGEEMRTDLNAGKSFEEAGTENTETFNLKPGDGQSTNRFASVYRRTRI